MCAALAQELWSRMGYICTTIHRNHNVKTTIYSHSVDNFNGFFWLFVFTSSIKIDLLIAL